VNTTGAWNIYRTRFLIKAKQLTEPLTFIDPFGREQCGKPGDYLIESSDGRRSIQRREIFEDIYVAMGPAEEAWPGHSTRPLEQLSPHITGPPRASA